MLERYGDTHFLYHALSPFLNFHRPCLFPTEIISPSGRVKRRYRQQDVTTPYEHFKALPTAHLSLKPGLTIETLDQYANSTTVLEASRTMQRARNKLLRIISHTTPLALVTAPASPRSYCRLRLQVGLLGVTVLGCSDSRERDWLLPDQGEVSPEVALVDSTWIAVPIREYGTLSGELTFGLPYALAILPDGALVVADAGDCTLKVIDRPSGQLANQWGRCGDGPGEFRFVRALSVHGDSLFA